MVPNRATLHIYSLVLFWTEIPCWGKFGPKRQILFNMCPSGSHFFRTTTGTTSGPGAFEESRFNMTFLTILGVTEMLCSFRLVLEGKIDAKIPESSRLEFLERLLASNFVLSDAEDNTFGPLSRYSRLNIVEKTTCNSLKVSTAKCLGSDWLFCFITRCKSGSFRNLFETITSLSELYCRFRGFILLVQTKKVISMNYSSSTSNWKSWR